jgi:hypothetical protein
MDKKIKPSEDAFSDLLYGFKAQNIGCMLQWLNKDAMAFAEKCAP